MTALLLASPVACSRASCLPETIAELLAGRDAALEAALR